MKRHPHNGRKHLQMKQPTRDSFSKIHKQAMQFYVKKKNNPIKKWAKDLNEHSPKNTHRWSKAHEKMLNITNYQRNASQNGYHQNIYKS